MIYLFVILLLVWVWIIAEWINAPPDPYDTNRQDNDSTTQPNDTNNQKI